MKRTWQAEHGSSAVFSTLGDGRPWVTHALCQAVTLTTNGPCHHSKETHRHGFHGCELKGPRQCGSSASCSPGCLLRCHCVGVPWSPEAFYFKSPPASMETLLTTVVPPVPIPEAWSVRAHQEWGRLQGLLGGEWEEGAGGGGSSQGT